MQYYPKYFSNLEVINKVQDIDKEIIKTSKVKTTNVEINSFR